MKDNGRLALIEWVDSHGPTDGRWKPVDDMREHCIALPCRSVGWIVEQSKAAIVVCPHQNSMEEGCRTFGQGEMTIPMCSVTRITHLSPRPARRKAKRAK